jgi:uncharacterized protein (TIGR02757 family)
MPTLKEILDQKYLQYNREEFIENDPISVPYRFEKKQDREIAGFFAAILAWGLRKTIIAKSLELMSRMDNRPHEFILHHSEQELKGLLGFKHRTFCDTDLLFFVLFLKNQYLASQSLEEAFLPSTNDKTVESGLIGLRKRFEALPDYPKRSLKHLSTPLQGSACKRLNMYLRWMVRSEGIDFGLWKKIPTHKLVCPLDVHVETVARHFGLLQREKGWKAALKLTERLKEFDSQDPVKYDFALFGMGAMG